MPRMIELIRQSAVPATVMRNAARGALTLPGPEVLEILVYLAQHQVFGEQARLTLASFDENACITAARDPQMTAEVLDYLSAPANLRPNLLPALLDNPALQESRIVELCASGSQIMARILLGHARVQGSPAALQALAANPRITPEQSTVVKELLGGASPERESDAQHGTPPDARQDAAPDEVDPMVEQFLAEHAHDMAAEEHKPFTLIGASDLEQKALNATESAVHLAKVAEEQENERPSVIQKIARMNVGHRVQLAMKGNKDERSILIRDGARIVSSAVLESPKLTDSEVDAFAALKNVSDTVLRGIGTKRKFLKRYSVIRILTMNPKTPVDLALTLVPHLMVNDLKNLTKNRDVSETVVKMAVKLFRDRTSSK